MFIDTLINAIKSAFITRKEFYKIKYSGGIGYETTSVKQYKIDCETLEDEYDGFVLYYGTSREFPKELFVIGKEQEFIYNGESVLLTCKDASDVGTIGACSYGNKSLAYGNLEDTGENFVLLFYDDSSYQDYGIEIDTKTAGTHTFEFEFLAKKYNKIDKKFLPYKDGNNMRF